MAEKLIDVKELAGKSDEVQKDFFDSFANTPIRVDPELKGKTFYMAVSQELFDDFPAKEN